MPSRGGSRGGSRSSSRPASRPASRPSSSQARATQRRAASAKASADRRKSNQKRQATQRKQQQQKRAKEQRERRRKDQQKRAQARRKFGYRSHGWRRAHIIISKPRKYDITAKVVLQKKVFFPGEVVEGVLHVTCNHTGPEGVPMRSLRVRFTGKEHGRSEATALSSVFIDQCVTIHGPPQAAVDAYRRDKEQRIRFAQQRLQTRDFTAVEELKHIRSEKEDEVLRATTGIGPMPVPQGAYAYPFRFVLPPAPTIPASCAIESDEGSAEVVYQVKGVLELVDDMDAFDAAYLDVIVPLPQQQYVQEAATLFYAPPPVVSSVKRSCCCFDRGECAVALQLGKSLFVADREQVEATVTIDATRCAEDIPGFKVQLVQVVDVVGVTGQVLCRIMRVVSESASPAGAARGAQAAYKVQLPLAASFAPSTTLFHSRWSYVLRGELTGGGAFGDMGVTVTQMLIDATPQLAPLFPPVSFDATQRVQRLFTRQKSDEGVSAPRPAPQEYLYAPPAGAAVAAIPVAFHSAGGGGGGIAVPEMRWATAPPVVFPPMPSVFVAAFDVQPQPVAPEDDTDDDDDDDPLNIFATPLGAAASVNQPYGSTETETSSGSVLMVPWTRE